MNKEKRQKIKVSDRIGTVSCIWVEADHPEYLIVLGHGAGAGMAHPFMDGLSRALASHAISTLRYNFPYMEQEKKRPDFPAVAHSTIEAVVEYACKQTDLPIFVGGKSFGGRMSSQWMAKNNNSNVAGLVFYGFPLHSPAKPGAERADHLFDIKVPMLFLQGDRDSLARLNLLQPVVDRLPLAELIVFDGANHSFRFLKSMNISEHQAWEKLATATLKFSSTVKKS